MVIKFHSLICGYFFFHQHWFKRLLFFSDACFCHILISRACGWVGLFLRPLFLTWVDVSFCGTTTFLLFVWCWMVVWFAHFSAYESCSHENSCTCSMTCRSGETRPYVVLCLALWRADTFHCICTKVFIPLKVPASPPTACHCLLYVGYPEG